MIYYPKWPAIQGRNTEPGFLFMADGLRVIQRFFGVDAGEGDVPGPAGTYRVGERLVLRGDISGEGDIELLGRFEGTVVIRGTVVIGEKAEVEGDISASQIVVGGRVRGNLSSTGVVEILPTGSLTGNVKSGSLAAAEGASLKGEIWVEREAKFPQDSPGLPPSGVRP